MSTLSKPHVTKLFKNKLDNYASLKKSIGRREAETFKVKLAAFKKSISGLFDISACKCTDFTSCACPKEKKVPIKERLFIVDQRSERKMYIRQIDQQVTKQLEKSLQRKLNKKICPTHNALQQDEPTVGAEPDSSSASSSNEDSDYEVPWRLKYSSAETNPLQNVAVACDRTGVSNRAAAMIVTAALHDINSGSPNIIDRNKVSRERKKSRVQSIGSTDYGNVTSLYYDGRKDRTLVMERSAEKLARKEIIEEHITVLAEPGSRYLGHFSPTSGNAKDIADGLFAFCEEKQIDVTRIDSFGCDGTNVNVGWKSGILRRLEKKLKRPLHWIICQLDSNELPLRHLLIQLDGKTSGPRQFTGPIGRLLYETNFENLPIVDFQPIPAEVIEIDENYSTDLSSDQRYLFEMYEAVSTGVCKSSLASQKPGVMAHSRWLTTASRALRVYVSTEDPPENLKLLVLYVMQVYTPMWFTIKRQHDISHATLHVFETISKCQMLPLKVREIVIPVVERNAYGAHPESILCAMISSSDKKYRELAWRRILRCREKNISSSVVRNFRVPKLNIKASSYVELIDWSEIPGSEPVFTASVTTDYIKEMIRKRTFLDLKIPALPCHTQSVECHIKLVTEASSSRMRSFK